MSLENLLAIQRLVRHEAGCSVVLKLIAAAERNLADARVTAISAENRFDAAYKAILQCALAALAARGYRTSTSQPGHHQTAIQTLPLTLAVDNGTVIVLDALRKQRHLTDYTGDGVSKALLAECIAQAESLLHHARATLGDP